MNIQLIYLKYQDTRPPPAYHPWYGDKKTDRRSEKGCGAAEDAQDPAEAVYAASDLKGGQSGEKTLSLTIS
jgi:hypothetical protein